MSAAIRTRGNLGKSEVSRLMTELRGVIQHRLTDSLDAFFAHIDEILFDKADNARNSNEQRSFFDTLRLLRNQKDAITEKTLQSFYRSFDALLSNDLSKGLPISGADSSSLALLEDAVLEEMIALDNLVSTVTGACDEELKYLTKRIEYLVGRHLVSEENPFVPEALGEALVQELNNLRLDTEPKFEVLHCFETHCLRLWPQLVSNCNQVLKERGVLPDLEKRRREVVKQKEQHREPSPPAAPPGNEENHIPGRVGADAPKAAESAASVEQLLSELHRYLRSSPRGGGGAPQSQVDAGSRQSLLDVIASETSAGKISQEIAYRLQDQGLEATLVELLNTRNSDDEFEEVALEDRSIIRILDHSFKKLRVRESYTAELANLVLRLELPVAGIVLRDPDFLGRQTHPGRRLINEIFKVSATFLDQESSASDPLRKEVDKMIERLSELDISPRELTRLLSEFIDFVDKDKKRQIVRERRLLEEEEAAVKVSQVHRFVYDQLAGLLIGKQLPRFMLRFVEDAWSKAMFLDVLRNGEESSGWLSKMEFLTRLLILHDKKNTLNDARKDDILKEVRNELESISFDPAAVGRWLALFESWLAAFLPEKVALPRSQSFIAVQVDELTLRLPGVVLAGPPEEEGELDDDALAHLEELRRGVWVEFKATEESEAFRCKLAGVVGRDAKFVFTNRKGSKVTEESRKQLAFKMKAGNVVILNNSHLFDDAYKEVLAELHNQSSSRYGRKAKTTNHKRGMAHRG